MKLSFTGKSALVAGAGGGMGLAIANGLIEQGLDVTLADIKDEPSNITDGPGRFTYRQSDLTNETAVDNLVSAAINDFGSIDYLVNSLGVLWLGKDVGVSKTELETWDRVFNINLRSIVILTRAVIPHMLKTRFGAMVHFSSVDALSGDPVPQDAYGASKAALIRLSKSLGIQHAADNIRSNTILPGPTLTPMQARWEGDAEAQANVAKHIPLGRLGSPVDMANACLFLLSDQAAYITATELVVDGGVTALP